MTELHRILGKQLPVTEVSGSRWQLTSPPICHDESPITAPMMRITEARENMGNTVFDSEMADFIHAMDEKQYRLENSHDPKHIKPKGRPRKSRRLVSKHEFKTTPK